MQHVRGGDRRQTSRRRIAGHDDVAARARAAPVFALASPFIAFGLTLTFAIFDLMMSLNAEWFSTMYGVYFFAGGLVGYFGYEIVQHFESRLRDDAKPDQLGTPDMLLLQF